MSKLTFSEKYLPLFELLNDAPAYKNVNTVLISGGR